MTGKSIQNSAHGYRVALDGLLEVWFSHSRSEQEELLLERYCKALIGTIIVQYGQALKQKDRKAAGFVKEELGPTLKRARALPSLPFSLRLATYSLFLHWFSFGVYRKLKQAVLTIRKALFNLNN